MMLIESWWEYQLSKKSRRWTHSRSRKIISFNLLACVINSKYTQHKKSR